MYHNLFEKSIDEIMVEAFGSTHLELDSVDDEAVDNLGKGIEEIRLALGVDNSWDWLNSLESD